MKRALEKRFCLDTNALITAKDNYYGFDIIPQFWTWLEERVLSGVVYSPLAVYKEWMGGSDQLKDWVKSLRRDGLRTVPSSQVQRRYGVVVDHVISVYDEHNAEHFLRKADAWAIAQAWQDKSYLVTYEKVAGPGAKRVMIPNVCKAICPGVECIKTPEMLQMLGGLG